MDEHGIDGFQGSARGFHDERQRADGCRDDGAGLREHDRRPGQPLECCPEHASPAEEHQEVVTEDGGRQHHGSGDEDVEHVPTDELLVRQERRQGDADSRRNGGGDRRYLEGKKERVELHCSPS